jgi:hypothetical protein
MTIRETIKREVKRRDLSGYALAKLVNNRVGMRMIQKYLGKGQADLSGSRIDILCEELGLELSPKRKR